MKKVKVENREGQILILNDTKELLSFLNDVCDLMKFEEVEQ